MPNFVWNEHDFLECLGVLPGIEEHAVRHTYLVEREDLLLTLTIHQYDGDVEIKLARQAADSYLLNIRLLGCAGVRYVKNPKGGDYLEFAPAKCFGSRYDGQSVIPMGIRLSVDPDIRIDLF